MGQKSKFVSEITKNWLANENSDKAAAITFYTLFSFPPLLFLSLNLATLIFHKDVVETVLLEWLLNFTGSEVIIAIREIFSSSANFQFGNSLISFLILFYASTKIFTEFRQALNDIYKTPTRESKGVIKDFINEKIVSMILVSLTCFLISLSLIVNFTLNKLGMSFRTNLPDIAFFHAINNLVSTVVLGGVFLALYKFLPRRKIQWSSAIAGSVTGIMLFEIGKYLLALYFSVSTIQNFYGPMGSLVILMFWVYYTVQIVLLGAECAIGFEGRKE